LECGRACKGAHTFFTSQREREINREWGEREKEREREGKREGEGERERERSVEYGY
jgi:hypothetical protein